MEFAKRGVKNISAKNVIIILLVVIIAVWLLFFSNIIKKECSTIECFNEQAVNCEPTKFTGIVDNNVFRYTINGYKGDSCLIDIELDRMGIGTPIELIDMFEGKSMECRIPSERLSNITINQMGDVINYCSGQFKESIYELIIKKLYGLVIQNMGEILNDLDKNLFKEK